MNTYRTVDLARMFGIHVNTVRLYERYGLIPKAERTQSGYRIFTELHVEQFKLARAALRVEVLQNGLRKQAVTIVKTSASGDFETALKLTKRYSDQVDQEIKHAEEAVRICRRMLAGIKEPCSRKDREQTMYTRKEAAGILGVTIDTLRNWELNGLFSVRRMANGYRVYTGEDIQRLTIIRSLRCANYSLSSILRMLNALSRNPSADIRKIIDTPGEDDDIITACDKLLTSLAEAKENAGYVESQIGKLMEMNRRGQL